MDSEQLKPACPQQPQPQPQPQQQQQQQQQQQTASVTRRRSAYAVPLCQLPGPALLGVFNSLLPADRQHLRRACRELLLLTEPLFAGIRAAREHLHAALDAARSRGCILERITVVTSLTTSPCCSSCSTCAQSSGPLLVDASLCSAIVQAAPHLAVLHLGHMDAQGCCMEESCHLAAEALLPLLAAAGLRELHLGCIDTAAAGGSRQQQEEGQQGGHHHHHHHHHHQQEQQQQQGQGPDHPPLQPHQQHQLMLHRLRRQQRQHLLQIDRQLRPLRHLTHLHTLSIGLTDLSQGWVERGCVMPLLQHLAALGGTLKRLTLQLHCVALPDLSPLSDLQRLRSLQLSCTCGRIQAADARPLAALQQLTRLVLAGGLRAGSGAVEVLAASLPSLHSLSAIGLEPDRDMSGGRVQVPWRELSLQQASFQDLAWLPLAGVQRLRMPRISLYQPGLDEPAMRRMVAEAVRNVAACPGFACSSTDGCSGAEAADGGMQLQGFLWRQSLPLWMARVLTPLGAACRQLRMLNVELGDPGVVTALTEAFPALTEVTLEFCRGLTLQHCMALLDGLPQIGQFTCARCQAPELSDADAAALVAYAAGLMKLRGRGVEVRIHPPPKAQHVAAAAAAAAVTINGSVAAVTVAAGQ